MRNQITFSLEFKRPVLEGLMSGESGAAPSSAANTISAPVCFTTGRSSTPGADSTMNPPRKELSGTG